MIRVVYGRLTDAEAEALLRPIRSDLAPVTAASRDVALAAGSEMEERLSRLGSLPVGGAVMTPAGALPVDFVIHVVVMSEDEPQTTGSVQRALRNGLGRAADWGLTSLALPPLGLGVGLVEPEVAAGALVEVLLSHLDEGQEPRELIIVTGSPYEEELFRGLVERGERARRAMGQEPAAEH